MRMLVTGGTGFIGSRLVLRGLEEGDEVRVLAQENTPAEASNRRRLERAGAELLLGSVNDEATVADAVKDVDVVVHLAAAQHEMSVPDDHFVSVNVQGTRRMLQASAEAGVKRFVHGSTIGVYGELEGTIDESSPCQPDNIYGETKLEGERLARDFTDELPVVIVRIPEVYGPGDRRLLKLFRSVQKGMFFIIGSGQNFHHLLYVDDLVDTLQTASVHPDAPGELLLLAGPEPVTTEEMVTWVAKVVGGRTPRVRLPMLPFRIAAAGLEDMLRPLGIQPPLHRRRLDFFRKSFTLSTDRARRVIGFSPEVNFAEGARRTANWYRKKGHLK